MLFGGSGGRWWGWEHGCKSGGMLVSGQVCGVCARKNKGFRGVKKGDGRHGGSAAVTAHCNCPRSQPRSHNLPARAPLPI